MGERRLEVYRWVIGAALALGASASCSGTSAIEHPGTGGNAASMSAGRSGAAAGGAAGSKAPGGRGGGSSAVGGSVAAGEAGAAGVADAGDAGDGSGASGGSQPARGGSGGLANGGQGGDLFDRCGYVHLHELQICTTPNDRFTHVPEAADVAACEAACTESDDCAGIAWTAAQVRCETVSSVCSPPWAPLPGAPRVYSKVCDEQGGCDLVDKGEAPCGGTPWPIPDVTDFAGCEAFCLEDPNCGGLVSYFELARPPGCYLASACDKVTNRGGVAQQGYERVCPLLAEEQLRPPTRLALGRQRSCLLFIDGRVACWGALAEVDYIWDGSWVVTHTLGLDGGPFTRLAATDWDTCGIRPNHEVTCSSEPGQTAMFDIADLDGSNGSGFLALRTDGRLDRDDRDAWVRAARGGRASCLLAADGHVDCSGYVNAADERMKDPSGQFVRVAVGHEFACGVHVDGTLECWGNDAHGQASPPAGTFTNVTAGATHACALKSDGTLECWGNDALGQATPPAGHFIEVVAAFDHTCAIPSGSRDQVICWGDDDGFQSSPPRELTPGAAKLLQWVVAGAVGFDGIYWTEDTDEGDPAYYWGPGPLPVHGCGLDQDGALLCSGTAGDPPSGSGFTQLSAGVGSTCALSSSGIECWGEAYDTEWTQETESPLNGTFQAGDFTQVSTGWDLACALRDDGTVLCWGPESSGALAPSGKFTSVAVGGAHRRFNRYACGVREDESITCWFYGDYVEDMHIMYDVAGAFQAVAVGYTVACALDTAGHLSCWDAGGGPTSEPEAALPVPAGAFTRVVAGDGQACALRANGSVTCWTLFEIYDHVAVEGDYPGPFVDLTMGGDYACGLLADGTLRCWGSYVE